MSQEYGLRFAAALLASCTMLSMAACDLKDNIPSSSNTSQNTSTEETTTTTEIETVPEETTSSVETTTSEETTTEETTTEETTAEETTKVTETALSESTTGTTAKPIGKTTVSNAYKRTFSKKYYGKFTTRYPKITIDGVSTADINKEISKKFGPIAKKNEGVVKYSYYIGKEYVSILFTVNLEAGLEGEDYYVYNVSRVTGKKLSKSEMLSLLGMDSNAFKSKVTAKVKKWWASNIPEYKKEKSAKKLYDKAIASKSINSAVPFVNSKGKKCYLLRQMKTPTQFLYIDIYGTI